MNANHGKKDQVRRASSDQSQLDASRESDPQSGCLGNQAGDESVGVSSENRTKQISSKPRVASYGGILTQLTEETSDQLAEYEERIEKALARIDKYRQKVEKLKARQLQLQEAIDEWQSEVVENVVIE